MRISKALALAGINSRRKCEELVSAGHIRVNGEVVRDLGRQVDFEKDEILFHGRPIQFEKYVYYIINKPVGYVTTASDPYADKTVFDLLPAQLVPKTQKPMPNRTRVFPVGRLDKNSSGILMLTNDGELSNRLIHPRYEMAKWYEARLDRALDPRDRAKLFKGVVLRDGIAKAEKVRMLSKRNIQLLIREGKKREVRRIFAAMDYEVVHLCRIAFGPVMLGNMPFGHGRFLSKAEVALLKEAAGMIPSKE
jgi:23S rRNA pseudouridine2605 synthase